MIKEFEAEIKRCPLSAIALLISVLLFIFYDSSKGFVEKGTFIVLILTLIGLIVYTYYTGRMFSLQHKTYMEGRAPLVDTRINMGNPNGFKFVIKNLKPLFTTVQVFMIVEFKGEDQYISDNFNGKELWRVPPLTDVSEDVDLTKTLKLTSQSNDSFRPTSEWYNMILREDQDMRIEIKIKSRSLDGIERENPPMSYYFDFERQKWVYDEKV